MKAVGYSTEDALKGGEFGKAAFSAVSADRAMEKGIKDWKEAASVASNMKDVLDYEHQQQISPFGDAPGPDDLPDEDNRPTLRVTMVPYMPDGNGGWTPVDLEAPGMGNISGENPGHGDSSSTGQDPSDARPDPPGGGEVGGGGGSDGGDPGEKPGPAEGGDGDEHEGGSGGGDGD